MQGADVFIDSVLSSSCYSPLLTSHTAAPPANSLAVRAPRPSKYLDIWSNEGSAVEFGSSPDDTRSHRHHGAHENVMDKFTHGKITTRMELGYLASQTDFNAQNASSIATKPNATHRSLPNICPTHPPSPLNLHRRPLPHSQRHQITEIQPHIRHHSRMLLCSPHAIPPRLAALSHTT